MYLPRVATVLTVAFVERLQHNQLMRPNDISAEILMLMVAAPDTTSALICATIESIVRNPRAYAKVIHEITTFTLQGNLSNPIVS